MMERSRTVGLRRMSLLLSGLAASAVVPGAWAEDGGGIRPDATMLLHPDVSSTEIVFGFANDLWLVPREGGVARKLASPPGRETLPRFSPDGSAIAFVGNYEGDRDLYTLPADGAGVAFRVTHHPANEVLCGWTDDGTGLLYYASGFSGLTRQTRVFEQPAGGGLHESLPMPYGAWTSVEPGGDWLAYVPHERDSRTWKRYRGGMATDIWLFNRSTYASRRITEWEGTDTMPMWHRGSVYYLSDAGEEHRLNIWRYGVEGGEREQVTRFADFDVKWPSLGPGPNGGGEIVFQHGPDLKLLDLRNGRVRTVEVVIPGDRPSLRAEVVEVADYITDADISPGGERAVFEARGEIWSLPGERGITRNLTRTDGVAERSPRWSPDGRWIAYVSDETGEYEVYVTQSDGRGETRRLTEGGQRWKTLRGWSPDSSWITYTENDGSLWLVAAEGGERRLVATDPWATEPVPSWSHDSRWLVFSLRDAGNGNRAVTFFELETGELTRATDPMFNSASPVFDREGDWVFFASQRVFRPTYSDIDTTFVYDNAGMLLAVPLNDEVENPRLPESDEVEWEDDDEGSDDGDAEGEAGEDGPDDENAGEGEGVTAEEGADAAFEGYDLDHPLWGIWRGTVRGLDAMNAMQPGMFSDDELPYRLTVLATEDGELFVETEFRGETSSPDSASFDESTGVYEATRQEGVVTSTSRATLEGDRLAGTWEVEIAGQRFSGAWEAARTDEAITAEMVEEIGGASGDVKPIEIDFEGFERRAMMLEVEPGSFSGLQVNDKNQLLYLRGGGGGSPPAVKLYDMDDEDKGERNVLTGVGEFRVSADGKKLGAASGAGFTIVNASPGQSMGEMIDTSRMSMRIDPRSEWRQIFRDAWRVHREFFYDAGMHGVDWAGVYDRYAPLVDLAVTREDVSFLIGEMISELNVGHAYYRGGDVESQPSEAVGLLGVDFEVGETEAGRAYRIASIHEGGEWDADARGPLSMPGVDVSVGDYVLAVNGVELTTEVDPWSAFVGLAGEVTELTVSDRPVLDDEARRVLVEPMASETGLRYRAWVERNRAYVEEVSGGEIGYIYVPNTGVQGQNELFRQFYGQRDKAALIIDERWNGGGQIPTRFIELLNRPRTNYWAVRHGRSWQSPPDSHQGPKAMLINGLAGSGGDMLPALFRRMGLGPLIGTRTWGGLVGLTGNPGLIDGGYTSVPTFGYYETDGTWGIEGHGVDPDIEVVDDPALMVSIAGEVADPQLDAAIEYLTATLETERYTPVTKPAGPDRSGMGIAEEDK